MCVLPCSVLAQAFCNDRIPILRSEFKGPPGSIMRAGVPAIVRHFPASGAYGEPSADQVVS